MCEIGVDDELDRGNLLLMLQVVWVTKLYKLPIEMNVC